MTTGIYLRRSHVFDFRQNVEARFTPKIEVQKDEVRDDGVLMGRVAFEKRQGFFAVLEVVNVSRVARLAKTFHDQPRFRRATLDDQYIDLYVHWLGRPIHILKDMFVGW